MNIDDLSKSQLLLLTLLVNFVMSIATGIVTVSLLDEAPATVTQTVNRIVEHTIETVAPQTQTSNTATPAQPTEEDLLVSAVSGDVARTVTLYSDATTSPVLTQGVYLPRTRAVIVVTESTLPDNALVEFANGATAQVSISRRDATLMIYGFSDVAALPQAPATVLLSAKNLKAGQAVIALTADGSAVTGIISKVDGEKITTTLPETPKGASAVDLKGQLVGIQSGAGNVYISAGHIDSLLTGP